MIVSLPGASFRAHLAECINALGYQSHKADPDLWWKPETRPQDKFEYYSYTLHYVDDILFIHHNPDGVLNKLNGYVQLKPGLVSNLTCILLLI